MRPCVSVAGTRWTRWTPDSNFSLENTPRPGNLGDDFLVAARLALAFGDDLDLPAIERRIALIHAEQVTGEKRRLIAAGPGADFEYSAFLVGCVLGQQRDQQVPFQPLDLLFDFRQFKACKLAHLAIGAGIVEQCPQPREFLLGLEITCYLGDDGLQFRIFAGQLDIDIRRRTFRHACLDLRQTAFELLHLFKGKLGH